MELTAFESVSYWRYTGGHMGLVLLVQKIGGKTPGPGRPQQISCLGR